jgi:hypothetical protein
MPSKFRDKGKAPRTKFESLNSQKLQNPAKLLSLTISSTKPITNPGMKQ